MISEISISLQVRTRALRACIWQHTNKGMRHKAAPESSFCLLMLTMYEKVSICTSPMSKLTLRTVKPVTESSSVVNTGAFAVPGGCGTPPNKGECHHVNSYHSGDDYSRLDFQKHHLLGP